MKKAVIDIDGVLNDYPMTWLTFLKEQYNLSFSNLSEAKEKMTYVGYKKLKEEYRKSEYKNEAIPKYGAKELLTYLRYNDYLIYIITARPLFKYDLLEKTITWLKNNELEYDYIYCSQKKDFTIFEKFGHIDIVIDDNCDNVNKIKDINGEDCLYINIINNDNINNNCNGIRVDSLDKALKLIKNNK